MDFVGNAHEVSSSKRHATKRKRWGRQKWKINRRCLCLGRDGWKRPLLRIALPDDKDLYRGVAHDKAMARVIGSQSNEGRGGIQAMESRRTCHRMAITPMGAEGHFKALLEDLRNRQTSERKLNFWCNEKKIHPLSNFHSARKIEWIDARRDTKAKKLRSSFEHIFASIERLN